MTVGILFLFCAISIIPMNAQDTQRPLPASRGNWWYVGGTGPGNYTTIQDAINHASDGDTVFVFHGTYVGYVLINRSISLLGEEKNTTIIIGYVAYTISILSDGVTMSGFTIENGGGRGEGVRIDSSFNTFVNNIVLIPHDDLRIFGDNNTIAGNVITGDQIFMSGDRNTIFGNIITNNDYGILFVDSWDNIISQNSFFHSGLFLSDDAAQNNTIINNTVNGKPLVYLSKESHLVLDGDAGQILLINCNNITVQNQEILNASAGIQLVGSSSCIIQGSSFLGNQYGLYLSGSNNTIEDNTLTDNNVAVRFFGDDNIFQRNVILHNVAGVYLYSSASNSIINNSITNNEYGMRLDSGSDGNSIINNTIAQNHQAMDITGDWNIISGNSITDGIDMVLSNHNTITHNMITNSEHYGMFLLFSDCNMILDNIIAHNNGEGIRLDVSDGNTICGNIIKNNTHDGIFLFGNNNTCSENTIINNTNGVSILENGRNTIIDNIISWNNWSGIYLKNSSRNAITQNTISHNTQGITFNSSANNTVLNNTFLRNTRHAFFENSTNTWDHNYWGRPRILPKLIFGTLEIRTQKIPWFNIDWHPAQKPL
jgi:parallel beta-helix repeat protein